MHDATPRARPEPECVGVRGGALFRCSRAPLAGGGSRAAEPPSAAPACRRCAHGALRARITHTVPSRPRTRSADRGTRELLGLMRGSSPLPVENVLEAV